MVVFVVVFFGGVDVFVVVIFIVVVFFCGHILGEIVSNIHIIFKLWCIGAIIRDIKRLSGHPYVGLLLGLNGATCTSATPRSPVTPSVQLVVLGFLSRNKFTSCNISIYSLHLMFE